MENKDLKVIVPHRKVATPVTSLKEILQDANAMSRIVNAEDAKAYAIHHSQVSDNPKSFFVVARKYRGLFGGKTIIINPKIFKRDDMRTLEEICLSYPHRGGKKVQRAMQIVCQFSFEDPNGISMQTIGDISKPEVQPFSLRGLAAQIFQHEYDHGNAVYIYDKK